MNNLIYGVNDKPKTMKEYLGYSLQVLFSCIEFWEYSSIVFCKILSKLHSTVQTYIPPDILAKNDSNSEKPEVIKRTK